MRIWRRVLGFLGLGQTPDRDEAAVQEIQKRHPAKPIPTKTEVKLTVGLDFGTSTLKCIVFAQIGDRRREERFVVPIDGLGLFPAVCWEQDGILFTRKRPAKVHREFRSPKACLRCEILEEEYPDSTYRDSGYSPSAICWALLSYGIGSIRAQIRQRFPAETYEFDWRKDVFWDMGAPLDGMKHEHLRKDFAALLWLSVNHGLEWPSESTPCAGLSGQYEAMRHNCPPPVKDSGGFVHADNCFVFPEAHVAVNAFLHRGGNLEPGLYFTCDVGAGTTDIAFFRFAPSAERPVVFYDTSSTFAGGDAIARELSRIYDLDSETANQSIIRGLTDEQVAALSGSLETLREKITQGRRTAFGRAYVKERRMETWKREMRGAAVLGGASQLPGIRRHCTDPLRTAVECEFIMVADIPLRKALPPDATELHRIAFGLSIPPTQFYEHWRPDQVDDFQPPEPELYDPFPEGNPYDE